MKKKKRSGSPVMKPFYADGGIHINPEHEGDFTAFAQQMGMSVQEAAAHVLANREKYSPERVKQANFARNAAEWKHADGGMTGHPFYATGGLFEAPSFIASGLTARKVPCLECGGGLPRADGGGSIVDYLGHQNMDASFANRKKLYKENFDGAYKGTADQNTRLLELLQSRSAEPPAPEPEPLVPPSALPAAAGAATGDAGSYTPFFQTEEDRDAYEKRLGEVANRALRWGDDSDFLRYTPYHPKADGNDCINGICGLNLRAGLRYSHPTDVDRYLGNTKFTESLHKGLEDYYQTYQPRVGAHLQKLDENGKPFHSMLVYKIDKDEKGRPTKYYVIHNGGDTKFVEKQFTPEDMQEELHPSDRKDPYMIAWNPGLSLDRAKLERERKGKAPYPYNQSEEEVRRYFGDTSLPTRFSLRESEGPDPNSPLYYLSGKNVQDQTRNELLGYLNDKDLDRQLRERLRIDDVTLQNLKPYIFGIMGVESNDQNISAARDVKERAAQLLKSDPSLGPFQIRLGSVGDRARKAFDIYEQDDLSKDLRKGYIAAVDRMLEAKRVMDDRVAKGYHPELAKADPYARAVYYYNQPQRALMSDEDYARKNFVYQPFTVPNPVGKDWRFSTALNASEDDVKSAYQKFLEESRLRGDRGSYMHQVQRAAYPLMMEVLDDEEPKFGIADAQLPAVEVVGKRKAKVKAKGGTVSTEGYKADSPDRFNTFNVIPSNQITMQGVPHPVMGMDNLGNQQLMLPGANYVFPGQAVLEVPVMESRESIVGSRESGVRSQALRQAQGDSARRYQQGGALAVIPPFTLETRMHEPRTKDSMLPADSPVFQQKQALDTAIQQREILSRTPAQQAAYEKALMAKRVAEENRKEWLRQRELDRRAKVMEESDEIQDNTSLFSPERWSRQNLATIAQAIPERGRFFPESVDGVGQFIDDYLNPLVYVGNLAKGLGEAPLQAEQTNSVVPYLRAVGTPLAAGALGINPVTTVTDPLKGAFVAKGLTGQANNLWKNVVQSNAISTLKDKAIEAAKDKYLPLPQQNPVTTVTPAPAASPAPPAPTSIPAPPPAPAPAPADRSFTDFSGTSLYDPQGRIVGMYRFKKDSNPGTNPGQQLAELMFVKNNGAVDTARGRYEIPAGVFTNQMIGGVSALKDTTGLNQYRVPLTGGTSYEAGGGVSQPLAGRGQTPAFGGKGLRIAAEGSGPKPVDQTEVQRQEVLEDLMSPMYRKRLQQELGREDVQDELDARINNVVNAKVVYNEGMPYPEYGAYVAKQPIGEILAGTPGWKLQSTVPYKPTGLMYDTGWRPRSSLTDPYNRNVPGTIYLEDVFKPGKKAPVEADTTPWHEFWHAAVDGGARTPYSTYKLIHNLTDPGTQPLIYRTHGFDSSYLTYGPEVYSRKKAAEKKLREASIYDSRTQTFTKDHYREMLNNPEIQKNSDYQELYNSVKGEGDEKMNNFIELMNGMASRSNGEDSTMARYGGRVSRKSIVKSRKSGVGSREFYNSSPFMQVGGSAGTTVAPPAPPGPPYFSDAGFYPYWMNNPFYTVPYRQPQGIGQPQGIAPTPPTLPPGPIPNFQNFMQKKGVLSKDNPVSTEPTPEAELMGLGQMKAFKDFMKKKTILSKDNQNPFNVNPSTEALPSPPPTTKTVWGPNISAATNLVTGLSALNSFVESGDRNRYKQQELTWNLGDNKGPVMPADWEERRGDYDVNSGGFRWDRMYAPQFGVAQMGGFFSEAQPNVPVTSAPEVPNIPMPRFDPAPERGSQPEIKVPSFKVNARVQPNKAAWEAFDYYVNDKGLAPHVAAGIVGNLYQESGLQTDVKEKGNTGNGRGIAQWDVRDRWKALNKWAEQEGRDPYDLYTQLDYVLAEPGEGEKALKALSEARTPEEASYLFGKLYERPADKSAAWGVRAGIARKLFEGSQPQAAYGGELRYRKGGEYVVTPEQLQQILANGGEVEYV